MSPPTSDLIRVEDIPNAGRGVIASQAIPKDTLILQSGPPATHVIFRQYRKEVCAQCFLYDRGRNLPVRIPDYAKVFCSEQCKYLWIAEQSPVGLRAWKALNVLVQARSKAITNQHGLPGMGPRPDSEDITSGWAGTEKLSMMRSECQKIAEMQDIDPDVLGYLLSCMLRHRADPECWEQDVLTLALDNNPFRSRQDFNAYLDSFMQLTYICQLNGLLIDELLPSSNSQVLHAGVQAASHNSFGIRDEDGEEYMGYALHPSASYFNHACDANVSKRRVGREWVFTSKRDISPGEECCITYLGGDEDDLSVSERRARTMEHWGFECMCARCCEESS